MSGEHAPIPPSLQYLLRRNLSFRAYTFKTSRYAPLLLVLRVQNFWTVVSDFWIYRRRSRLHFNYFIRHLLADWRYGESEVSVRVIKNLNGHTNPRPPLSLLLKPPSPLLAEISMSNWALIWGDKALIACESTEQRVFSKHYDQDILKQTLLFHKMYYDKAFLEFEFMRRGKSAISSYNNPLLGVLHYPDIVWDAQVKNLESRK